MKLRLFLFQVIFVCSLSFSLNAQTPRYARVISANANLRDAPSITSVSEEEIAEGTLVKVLDEKLPWYVVRVVNRVGWLHGNAIEFISIQDSTSEPKTQQMVAPKQSSSLPRAQPRESLPVTPRATAGGHVEPTTERGYIRGPRGGCYYISGSGRKVYVDRGLCN